MSSDRNYGQYRDFDKVQTARWNKLQCSQEANNLLNYNIQLEDLTLCTGGNSGRVLINSCSLDLLKGRKYGLVGRNGVGKTTLLRHIAEHNIMGIFDHLRCIYIDDGSRVAIDDPDVTCIQFLMAMHKERLTLQEELVELLESTEDINTEALDHLLEKLTLLKADQAEARARKVLHGLMMDAERPTSLLSGGQRHVVALAAALFIEADVLLLDEPTNHIDIHGICWLEEFLKTTKSTVIAVSHDQDFLNGFTTDIINFESKTLKPYKGNYESFVNTRAIQQQQHQSAFIAQETRRKRCESTIATLQARSVRLGGDGSKMIRARQRQLKHRLGASLNNVHWKYGLMGPRPEILAPPEEEPYYFQLDTDVSDVPEASGKGETLLLKLVDVAHTYTASSNKPPVIKDVNFDITLSTRLALVGQNGTGKSTIIKIIAGELAPSAGDVIRWDGLRVGYFHQHAVKEIQNVTTPALAYLHEEHPTLSTQDCRDLLGSLGLLGEIAEATPINALSDGQRSRVVFASLMGTDPHVLLLDEPTSHMDAETSGAITTAVTEFAGAVVVASHDRNFVTEVACEMLCTDHTRRGFFDGDFEDYKRAVLAKSTAQTAGVKVTAKQAPITRKQEPIAVTTTAEGETTTTDEKPRNTTPPPNYGHVTCRHCGEGHFSHSCPNKTSATAGSIGDAESAQKKPAPKPKAAPPQGKKAVLPPTTEKAKDGKGDWKVSVSKSTMRRLKKGVQ